MKKVIKICLAIIFVLIVGILVFISNSNIKRRVDINDIETDDKFKNVIYDNEEVWDEFVLEILTIERINLKTTVKEGTSNEGLSSYIGHIEGIATYDVNIGLEVHNRGYENDYFAQLNELEQWKEKNRCKKIQKDTNDILK